MTKKIQEAICKYIILKGHEAVCENFGYNWEMDVASLSKSGMLHEYEVKISRSDFLADKKQKSTKFTHYEMRNDRTCPHFFYYVCPEGLIKKDEIPIWAGLYYYSEGEIWLVKNCKKLHGTSIGIEKVLRKMLRLNIQRRYLGGSMLTYLNRKIVEKHKEQAKQLKTNESLFGDKDDMTFKEEMSYNPKINTNE